jgi:hypothetical protein
MKICAVRFALLIRKALPTSFIKLGKVCFILSVHYMNGALSSNNDVWAKVA